MSLVVTALAAKCPFPQQLVSFDVTAHKLSSLLSLNNLWPLMLYAPQVVKSRPPSTTCEHWCYTLHKLSSLWFPHTMIILLYSEAHTLNHEYSISSWKSSSLNSYLYTIQCTLSSKYNHILIHILTWQMISYLQNM